MKKLTHSLCTLTGALALAAGACSSSNPTPSGSGGSGGGGTSGNPNAIPLAPSTTGFVTGNAAGVIGAWYAYGDSIGSAAAGTSDGDVADSDCVKKGGFMASQCSQVTTPMPGAPFPPDATTGAMCTTGTAAKVLMGTNGSPDYSDMWGSGIGLDFNNPGGDAGVKGVWDGSGYSGISFDFTGDMIPVKSMRVNFPFTGEHGTDSPYWQGATQMYSTLTNGAHVEIHWADVGGPMYLSGFSSYKFDPTMIQSIQFQVFTNTTAASPYSFCVNNLSVLK